MSLSPATRTRIETLLANHRVVLFMKGTRHAPQCGFSAAAADRLNALLDDYHSVDVLADEEIRAGIKDFGNWPTIPQLYIDGELVGGADIVQSMFDSGELHGVLGVAAPDRTPPALTISDAAVEKVRAALADAGCELVEQPVASTAALNRLVRRFPVALMADESLTGPESAFEIAKTKGADVFAVKIEQSGGLFNAQRVAAIADTAGIELYGGTMLEGAVGTVASAHVFSTFANLQWGTELFGPLLLTEEILATPLDYSDFELTVPDGPGLGVELDEDRLKFFAREGLRKTISVAK